MNEEMKLFIKENRNSFPKYFKVKELKKHDRMGELISIHFMGELIGFYVLEQEKFKSLFIKKAYRTRSHQILPKLFSHLKTRVDYCTLAVNERSARVKKLALKNGFVATDKYVEGKTHRLRIYSWSL